MPERRSRVLLAQVGALAVVLTAAAAASTQRSWQDADLIAALAALAIGTHLLPLLARGVHISGSFMGLVLAMALAGPGPAVAIGVSAVVLDAVRTRPPLWHLVDDLLTYALFPLVGGLFFDALKAADVDQRAPAFAVAVGVAFLALNLLNFVLIVEQRRLHRPETRPLGQMLRLNVLPVLPWQLAGALVTATVVYGQAQFGMPAVGLLVLVLVTFQLLLRAVLDAEHRRDELEASFRELERVHEGLLVAMLETVSLRDPGTARHSVAVARCARAVAGAAGLSAADQVLVHTAGLLHDIGKASFDDALLEARGPLTDRQRALIRTHPGKGARTLREVPGYEEVADVVEAHHERVDGTGYPHGLAADDIPELARIIAVAEAYDAMTARDSYRAPVGHAEAVAELRRASGTQLDPRFVELFVTVVEQGSDAPPQADGRDLERELQHTRSVLRIAAGESLRCANP